VTKCLSKNDQDVSAKKKQVHVPIGCICLSKGVHLGLPIEGKNTFLYHLFPNIYTCCTSVNIIFKNHYKLIVKYIYC